MKIDYLALDEQVNDYIEVLKNDEIDTIALDIEGEYNLHQYGEKLCLIQVFDGLRNIILDPFKVSDETVSSFFRLPGITKIMYDSSGDQRLILKQYGVRIDSIIDLRPAAEVLDLPRKDLASVIELYLGVQKKRNYQRYNWTRRPVEPGALEYAMNDVLYLFTLRDKMLAEIERANLMEEYLRLNNDVNTRTINLDRQPGFFRKPAFIKLKNDQRDRVKKIFYIRERYAEKYNVPPNFIFSNDTIIRVGTGNLHFDEVRLYRSLRPGDRGKLSAEITSVVNQ